MRGHRSKEIWGKRCGNGSTLSMHVPEKEREKEREKRREREDNRKRASAAEPISEASPAR